jgi:hypothetical protein
MATRQLQYRPLNRERNEIRLLRILPPSSSNLVSVLEFNPDNVQCEIQHYSLDDIIAAKQRTGHESRPTSEAAEETALQADFASLSVVDTWKMDRSAYIRAAKEAMHPERMSLLARYYLSQEERFKSLIPHSGWDSDEEERLFEYWMKSWIWAPLVNKYSESKHLSGYIALSYVWAQKPPVSDTAANHLKLYRIFQDISPTCADLMAKALPSVTETPTAAEGQVEIWLNGQPKSVGANLYHALRALREIPEVRAGMPVWVDALCINQNDIDERNFQVKRMDSIYTNSTRVITWLSEADIQHTMALEFMNVLGEYLGKLEAVDKDVATAWFQSFDLHYMVRYQALLSDLPYWNRTWIAQEAVLAPPLSSIICQNRRFYWKNILHFVYSFNKRRTEAQSTFNLLRHYDLSDPMLGRKWLTFNSHMYCLHDAFGIRNARETIPLHQSMDGWFGSLYLRLASQSNCKDTRDRVYGFMSIYPGNVGNFIKPDYAPTKTTAQVMGDLAMAHIKATSTLDWMILATDLAPSVDPWPSWVPNISIPYKDVTLSWIAGQNPQGNRKIAEVSFGPEESCGVPALHAKGYKLDVISGAGSNYIREMDLVHPTIQSADNMQILMENLETHMAAQVKYLLPAMELESFAWTQQFIISYFIEKHQAQGLPPPSIENMSQHKYGDNAGLRAALETCMKTIGWEPNPEHKDVRSIFAIPRQMAVEAPGQESTPGLQGQDFTDFRSRNESLDLWGWSLESFFDQEKIGNPPDITGSMLKHLTDMHRSRRGNLFTTAGGWLGANLCRILPGDEVFLLFGCRMPIALRRVGDSYRRVGAVYVCGAMNGEAMDELEAKGAALCEVIIA